MFKEALSKFFGKYTLFAEDKSQRILSALPDEEWEKLQSFDPRTQNPIDILADITISLKNKGNPEPQRLDYHDMLDVLERRASQVISENTFQLGQK